MKGSLLLGIEACGLQSLRPWSCHAGGIAAAKLGAPKVLISDRDSLASC